MNVTQDAYPCVRFPRRYYIVGSGFGAVIWSGVFENLGARWAYLLGGTLVSVR